MPQPHPDHQGRSSLKNLDGLRLGLHDPAPGGAGDLGDLGGRGGTRRGGVSAPAPRWDLGLVGRLAVVGLWVLTVSWAVDAEDWQELRRLVSLPSIEDTVAASQAATEQAMAALDAYLAAAAAVEAEGAAGAATDAATDAATAAADAATDAAAAAADAATDAADAATDLSLAIPPAPAAAPPRDCVLYAVKDTSSGSQRRARLFVATSDPRPEAALALGYDATVHAAMDHGYAFVTRRQDGLDPLEHSAGTAIAWVRFNRGNTPVIDTRMEGHVVTDTAGHPQLGLLAAERRDVTGTQVGRAWLDLLRSAGRNVCGA